MNVSSRIVVTVDGFAGSGKTTISKLLARKLGFAHLNSGLLYRAVALLAIQEGVDLSSGGALERLVREHSIKLTCDVNLSSRLSIDGDDVTDQLQIPQVSEATSRAATHVEVRRVLIPFQREAFPGYSLVAEGRDMGTVVFPDAEIKFFVQASQEVRIERRLRQLYGSPSDIKGDPVLFDDELRKKMEIEIVERDKRDAERSLCPAKPAPDAILVDNSSEPLTSVIDSMYDAVRKKGYNVGVGQG